MQTTTKRLLLIGQGLQALDTVKLTGPNAAKVRLTAARNRRVVTQHAEDYEEARKKLIRDLTKGEEEIPNGSPALKEYGRQMEAALNAEVDVKLWWISWQDVASAELTPTAIEQLWPILKGVPEAAADEVA